ncbi:MAG TPA: hypothetical protein VMT47_02320, partial [Polyangia bacterium]|nr:hypothetical protein [Polyangia bacterium]
MSLRCRGSVVPSICLVVSLALGCAGAGGRRAAPSGEAVVAAQSAVAAESRTVVYVGLAGGAVATLHLNLATGTLGRRA